MNKLAQKVSLWLGSTWAIGCFGTWLIVHNIFAKNYVTFISDMAILITLLILRSENVQSKRQEIDIREAKNTAKRLEKMFKAKGL